MRKTYKRILLNLSGEGLMGTQAFGIDENVLSMVTDSIKKVHSKKIELCIVSIFFCV